jgi:hypothetical protein
MATPVDPIFTAIERDRIAYAAFAASLNKTDGRKAAQEKGREVTQATRMLTETRAASGTMLLANLRMTAFGVRGRRAVLQLTARDNPQCVVRQRPPQRRTCTAPSAGSSNHSRSIA